MAGSSQSAASAMVTTTISQGPNRVAGNRQSGSRSSTFQTSQTSGVNFSYRPHFNTNLIDDYDDDELGASGSLASQTVGELHFEPFETMYTHRSGARHCEMYLSGPEEESGTQANTAMVRPVSNNRLVLPRDMSTFSLAVSPGGDGPHKTVDPNGSPKPAFTFMKAEKSVVGGAESHMLQSSVDSQGPNHTDTGKHLNQQDNDDDDTQA